MCTVSVGHTHRQKVRRPNSNPHFDLHKRINGGSHFFFSFIPQFLKECVGLLSEKKNYTHLSTICGYQKVVSWGLDAPHFICGFWPCTTRQGKDKMCVCVADKEKPNTHTSALDKTEQGYD